MRPLHIRSTYAQIVKSTNYIGLLHALSYFRNLIISRWEMSDYHIFRFTLLLNHYCLVWSWMLFATGLWLESWAKCGFMNYEITSLCIIDEILARSSIPTVAEFITVVKFNKASVRVDHMIVLSNIKVLNSKSFIQICFELW